MCDEKGWFFSAVAPVVSTRSGSARARSETRICSAVMTTPPPSSAGSWRAVQCSATSTWRVRAAASSSQLRLAAGDSAGVDVKFGDGPVDKPPIGWRMPIA